MVCGVPVKTRAREAKCILCIHTHLRARVDEREVDGDDTALLLVVPRLGVLQAHRHLVVFDVRGFNRELRSLACLCMYVPRQARASSHPFLISYTKASSVLTSREGSAPSKRLQIS